MLVAQTTLTGAGTVAEKTLFNYSLFSSTRLNIVYKMAEIIAEGLATFIVDGLQNEVKIKEAR